jgi:hypothetical protein
MKANKLKRRMVRSPQEFVDLTEGFASPGQFRIHVWKFGRNRLELAHRTGRQPNPARKTTAYMLGTSVSMIH